MPKEKNANQKFKNLNNMVEKELAKKGANQAKVPLIVRGFNIFLFGLSMILIIEHIMFNGFEIYDSTQFFNILGYFVKPLIILLPLIMGILYIPINLIIIIRHKINKVVQKVSGQKVATTTISLIVLFVVIIILTATFVETKYLIADEILICIATILILTDNLMLKNSVIMIEDYSRLNTLKYKIQNYSIMENKDVEQIVLWEKYLSYAVSFGVANKIVKRLQGLHLDDDLLNLISKEKFADFIQTDYYMFYKYTSLDRRFLNAYGETTGKVFKSMGYSSQGESGFSSGGGRRIFWRRRLFRRWRKWPEAEVLFKNKL